MIRIVQAVVVGLLAIFGGMVLGGSTVGADSQFNWLNNSVGPKILESQRIERTSRCIYEKVPTQDKPNSPIIEQNMCVTRGKHIKSGISNWYGLSYIAMPGDAVFKRISEKSWFTVSAIEDSDGVIIQIANLNTRGHRILIYDQYKDVITVQPASHGYFSINIENKPIYTNNHDNTEFLALTYALSNNRKFLVYTTGGDYGYRGLVHLVNLENGTSRIVGHEGYSYTYNPMPAPAYAVSDDGKWIAEGGYSIKIWNTEESVCRDNDEWSDTYAYDRCLFKIYDWDSFGVPEPTAEYYSVNSLKFNSVSSELSFVFKGYISDEYGYSVILEAPGYQQPEDQLDYLALGDSYTSGEGDMEGDGRFYLKGTGDRGRCRISSRSYPYLLRDHYKILPKKMESVACSGAQVVFDYMGVSDNYLGQNKDFEKISENERIQKRIDAISEFTPGYVKQLDFVRQYKPRVVTFTGSGNDIGFVDILKYCTEPSNLFVPYTCDFAIKDSRLSKMLFSSIDTQASYMKMFVEGIKEASPDSKIIIIGYPSFIARSSLFGGNKLFCGLDGGFLNDTEKAI